MRTKNNVGHDQTHKKESSMKPIRTIHFDKTTDVPNSALPVLLYRSVLPDHAADKARAFRGRFKVNGWTGVWTDTIYDYTPTFIPTRTRCSESRRVKRRYGLVETVAHS